jgi:hypothetical protein
MVGEGVFYAVIVDMWLRFFMEILTTGINP